MAIYKAEGTDLLRFFLSFEHRYSVELDANRIVRTYQSDWGLDYYIIYDPDAFAVNIALYSKRLTHKTFRLLII